MITLNLRDPHLVENAKAVTELRRMGVYSDEQLQLMYEEQLRRDAERAKAALQKS